MKTPTLSTLPQTTPALAEMFHDLNDSLAAFSMEAAELHKAVAVTDDASRALFTALSRITAYADQLQMVLALMGEDIRVTEEIGMALAPVAEFDNRFYEWLRTARKGGVVVN